MTGPNLQFSLVRNTHYFSTRPGAVEKLEPLCDAVQLVPDQLLHPPGPADWVVRRGKLRLSQFLDDGREITRSVLQAGSVFFTREPDPDGAADVNPVDDPEADRYVLADIVVMALSEGEVWRLPPGALGVED